MPEYVSVREAARRLDMNPQSLYRMVWREDFPGVVHIGRAIRIPSGALFGLPAYEPRAATSTHGEDQPGESE